jgi:hypothetical protein
LCSDARKLVLFFISISIFLRSATFLTWLSFKSSVSKRA